MKPQYDGSKAAGLKIGFYHYLRSNNPIMKIAKLLIHSVEEQARKFNSQSSIKHAKATVDELKPSELKVDNGWFAKHTYLLSTIQKVYNIW